MTSQKGKTSKIDYGLVLTLMLMCLVSLISIYGAQKAGQLDENYLVKQVIWYVVGVCIIAVTIHFDSDQLKKLSWYLYAFGIVLLGFLIIAPESIAHVTKGQKSWFTVPFMGTFQPSEVVKVFVIIALARTIVDHHDKYLIKTVKTDFWLLIKLGLVAALPLALIMQQPDLGTSLVIVSILLGIIFVSGITWKLLLPIFGGGGLLAGIILYFVIWMPQILEKYLHVKPYQFNRIYSWLDPYKYKSDSGYQLINSLLAIGSGQTLGKGFNISEVDIPERQTDFIFSMIGENFGFIGASVVVSLFFMLIYHITKASLETKNNFYSYICAGVIAMITFHVFENIGMTIGLLPITGIPLPFISYGGSSLMGNMLAIGLIFSIRYHYKKYMFGTEK
ncbi:rod shape-determining protein RodA [Heyndrickxia sporothermodurans]|uniref:Rod shape-determining protein RodA n=1 Tax=Heyndrickxia sporothermodurans TaxID=46224 RepID=A0AB37HGA8_9BACI|nr:FtsW/RodA/SpoVE family cell cycle protein [Heyndrickxia sporothermodurans]MBL5767818.1 rod shape-determining protein RodA [Heyndrickxia sporothermodurans]MBL5771401.1 rod shape-determining protein RodA [Heyndrickxia sporothermodurans]MBL5775140.1 rod shape-determining protein RodA [Heyndrickxia sporothermodurans]MBL5779044.1 rod shape-determining protein RodA [Heyndrickxia sporothermodurans]MBL5782087.1 rod shape-determining protein RodA [Heyndrickxia sporothermodurans]